MNALRIQVLLWHLFIGRRFYSESFFLHPGKEPRCPQMLALLRCAPPLLPFPLYASEDEKLISIRIHGTDIFTYIWLRYMIDVGKYSIHGMNPSWIEGYGGYRYRWIDILTLYQMCQMSLFQNLFWWMVLGWKRVNIFHGCPIASLGSGLIDFLENSSEWREWRR